MSRTGTHCDPTPLGLKNPMIWRSMSSSWWGRRMAESMSFSVGVDTLLQAIRPYGREASAFPPALDETNARRDSGEALRQWFVRVVNRFCAGDPKRTAVEDNIAVFVKLAWRDRKRLVYANIQTV